MKTIIKITELNHEDIVNILSMLTCENDFGLSYKKSDYNSIPKDKMQGVCFEDKLADCLLNGKSIQVIDLQADEEVYGNLKHKIDAEDGSVIYTVTLEDFIRGLEIPEAAKYVQDIVDEKDDYWTSYNLIQFILFGELIYG